jgi:hypothetical protein
MAVTVFSLLPFPLQLAITSDSMTKRTFIAAAALVLLSLWVGLSVGYNRGARAEQLLWTATAQVEPMGVVTLDDKPVRIVYRNPRSGPVLTASIAKPMVNGPDPRTYLQYPGLRP